jgi:hypothetical protein
MNNIVVLDSKQLFLMKYVLITILPIIQKRIRIEMTSINTDAWLVNFILSFSGLSPILIGPKVNIFQINVTQKAATMCAPIGLDPNGKGPD